MMTFVMKIAVILFLVYSPSMALAGKIKPRSVANVNASNSEQLLVVLKNDCLDIYKSMEEKKRADVCDCVIRAYKKKLTETEYLRMLAKKNLKLYSDEELKKIKATDDFNIIENFEIDVHDNCKKDSKFEVKDE